MTGFSAEDQGFMAQALALGQGNLGQTGTNPSVGCVIVHGGVVAGSAATAKGGRPHAETQALAMAGELARGATVYVTLEPCSHHGRTGPCALALAAAGVARVVVATLDPNPLVAGRGIAMLEAAGITAETGLMATEARRLHAGHINRVTRGRPEIFLKMSVSADGFIGLEGRGQIAISGPEAKAHAHWLRAHSDGILVGIGTALADDPELTCRLAGLEHRSPVRIVLDSAARLPLASKLVQTAGAVRVIAVTATDADPVRVDALQKAGAEILQVPRAPDGSTDLAAVAGRLCDAGFNRIMVEGGAHVAAGLHRAGLLDAVHLVQSPRVLGAGGVPALAGVAVSALKEDPYCVSETRQLGADTLTVAWHKDWT